LTKAQSEKRKVKAQFIKPPLHYSASRSKNVYTVPLLSLLLLSLFQLKLVLGSRFSLGEWVIYLTFVFVIGGDGADELCSLRNCSCHLGEPQHAVKNASREQLLRIAGMTHQIGARYVACTYICTPVIFSLSEIIFVIVNDFKLPYVSWTYALDVL